MSDALCVLFYMSRQADAFDLPFFFIEIYLWKCEKELRNLIARVTFTSHELNMLHLIEIFNNQLALTTNIVV